MFPATHRQVYLGEQWFPQSALQYNFADTYSINIAWRCQCDSQGE